MANVLTPDRVWNLKQAKTLAKRMFGQNADALFDATALEKPERDKLRAMTREEIDALSERDHNRRTLNLMRRKCRIGERKAIAGLLAYFVVIAEGDTWKEAFEKAAKKQ